MIDLVKEKPITLNAARALPELNRDGRRPDVASLYRWSGKGLRGLRLECVQIGGSRCTTVEAVRRFIRALTERDIGASSTATEDAEDAERAEAELTAAWEADSRAARHRGGAAVVGHDG